MNVAYRWLQDYVKTTTPPEVLGEKFRMTSSEMEGIRPPFVFHEKIVSALVRKVEKHPNADKLKVAIVEIGEEKYTIVCGGTNLAVGQIVIVALPGAILNRNTTHEIVIKKVEIRGVESQGMICASEELGLPVSPHENHSILVLSPGTASGLPATEALGLDDIVLDLEITPNRGDLLSYYGLAREVAAFEHRSLQEIQIAPIEEQPEFISFETKVEESKLCSRYCNLLFEIDEVSESPWWLQKRLILAGIRPINVVVDITNYVMLETGQPLHAFDYDLLPQPKRRSTPLLTVRSGRKDERITLLDNSERIIQVNDIIITDCNDEAIDLAGIMGGQNSAITTTTKRFLLEAATFSGPHIRRTSRRLGIRTEASLRFEKGIDSELPITALKRATYLLKEVSTAHPISIIVDTDKRHPNPKPRIHLSFNRIQQVLGVHINAAECKTILSKLGFQLPNFTKSGFDAIPPSWRPDVRLEEDVLEEIVRIWGYDRIPLTLPSGVLQAPFPNPHFETLNRIRHGLAQMGGYELVSQPFVSQKSLTQLGINPTTAIKLPNPLSKEGEYLLTTHALTFLDNFANSNRETVPLTLFEIGKIFTNPHTESEVLSLALRTTTVSDTAVQTMKSYLERVAAITGRAITYSKQQNISYLVPETSVQILINNQPAGVLGFITPEIVQEVKIRRGRAILFAELSTETLISAQSIARFYQPLPKFPSIERDITVTLDKHIPFSKIEEILAHHTSSLLKSWETQNIYTGEPLASNKKAITLHLTFGSIERTLEEAEILPLLEIICNELHQSLEALIV